MAGRTGDLFNLLAASEAMITRAGARVPGYVVPQPFRIQLNTLQRRQKRLEYLLPLFQEKGILQDRISAQRRGPNLGIAPLVIAAGAGAVLGLSAIGGWVYSHFTDAKALDAQTKVYQDIRNDGGDSKTAANIVFGGQQDWSGIMTRVVIITGLITGVYLVSKFLK